MGEEKKKPDEEQKTEESKKTEEGKKGEEVKDSKEPPTVYKIVLRVYLHCEGCARKVRRCLKGFEGVEDVMTDCRTHRVVVKGEKADPMKVMERVQRKSHRQVELLSPIAKADDGKEMAENKTEEKKEEPPATITVLLKVHMHCEACAQEIRKRIQRMKGVECVETDLKGSQVTVKGVFDPPRLADYVYKRTGKHAVIVKQESGEEENPKEVKKDEGEAEKAESPSPEEVAAGEGKAEEEPSLPSPSPPVVEVKKSEYNYHYVPAMYAWEFAKYPPQLFSDENPNACSVM